MAAEPESVTDSTDPRYLASPPHPAAADQNWRTLTEAANQAYAADDLQSALELYHRALVEAERLFTQALRTAMSIPVPVIYNVSCHNLAEIARRAGHDDCAEALLMRAYDKLVTAAESPLTPLRLRLDCARHLKQALAILVQHLHRRNIPDERIAACVDRAKHAALTVFRTARHAELAKLDCEHCPLIPS